MIDAGSKAGAETDNNNINVAQTIERNETVEDGDQTFDDGGTGAIQDNSIHKGASRDVELSRE